MKRICAVTCEDIVNPRYPAKPLCSGSENPIRFLIQDPFGLRRAIVPVFMSNGGNLVGSGTAFHIDRFGTVVTADHVTESLRQNVEFCGFEPNVEKQFNLPPSDSRPFLWLGGILVFGQTRLPDGMLVGAKSVRFPIKQRADPMAALTGRHDIEAAADVAVLQIERVQHGEWIATLPIRLTGWHPKRGDTVVAVGFPEIRSEILDDSTARQLLSESMYGGYGIVTAVYPNGRDRSNPTPVVEVEADWASGMSGGPVFNDAGEVIGLVSRSIAPEQDGELGRAWVACFQLIPELTPLLPTIDPCNPANRLGWAVLRSEHWQMIHFCETEEEAAKIVQSLPNEYRYEVRFGSNRVGTDDFITVKKNFGN